jgi:hypothetical protein
MYASIELAAGAEPGLQVPASAVVYTGPRRLVFLDLGDGRFKPKEVRVGVEVDGMYEVLEGLHAGDVVATSGVFLIAAEARIATAARYWDDAADVDGVEGGAAGSTTAPPAPLSPLHGPKAPPPSAPTRTPIRSAAAATSPPSSPSVVYGCPMHPEVRSATPGKCPKCGMDLERVPGGASK